MRIVVVGAGVAGLTAANILHAHEHDVVVLEGRDRIGGRTWTRPLGSGYADSGAAWIHGVEGNPLVPLFELLENPRHDTSDRDMHFFSSEDGWWSDEEHDLVDVFWEAYDPEALRDHMGSDATIADAVEAHIALHRLDDRHAELFRFIINVEEAGLNVAAPADVASMIGSNQFDELDGRNDIPRGGYLSLVGPLAEPLRIELDTVVDTIGRADDGVTIASGDRRWEADHVVVTVPLGVLKADTITFEPPLPDRTRDAIASLGMGDLRKLLLEFDNVYWPANGQWGYQSPDEAFPFIYDLTPFNGAPVIEMEFGTQFGAATDDLSDDEFVDLALDALGQICGADLPRPLAYVRTSWTHDPMSLGSYSFVPYPASADAMDVLAEPMGRLQLAGEATMRRFHSTVHGAYLSGRRAASHILGTTDVSLTFGPAPDSTPT